MDTKSLLDYLKIVVDLEKNKYIQIRTINQIKNQVKQYENQVTENKKLIRGAAYIKERSTLDTNNVVVDKKGRGFALFAVYYCAVLGASVFYKLTDFLTGGSRMPVVVLGLIGAVIGGSIPWGIWKNILKKRRREEIEKIAALQEADNRAVIESNNQTELFRKAIPKLQKECEAIQSAYEVTIKTLQKIYAVGIIPVKYREMLPVCMFYDYILNGRTYSLERKGADPGAINMYADEIWRKVIVEKFNQAIHQMEMIRENQKVFYNSMIEAQNRSNELLNTINTNIMGFRNDVNERLDSLNYKTEQIANCEQYLSFVAYQGYMKS